MSYFLFSRTLLDTQQLSNCFILAVIKKEFNEIISLNSFLKYI